MGNGTCGKRLDSIGVENTEANRREYRELLLSTPGLGEYIGGAILFEETLYQSGSDGATFVDTLNKQGIIPGIKVDKGLVPPAVPGIMFLSGGQSEMESTLNLNAMNQTPNPWHVSFS